MFSGKSSLRAAEPKQAAPVNKALQTYLSKYTTDGDAKKKKKNKRPKPAAAGVRILDEDLSGFAAAPLLEEDEDDDCEALDTTWHSIRMHRPPQATWMALTSLRHLPCIAPHQSLTASMPAAVAPVIANEEEAENVKRQLEMVG